MKRALLLMAVVLLGPAGCQNKPPSASGQGADGKAGDKPSTAALLAAENALKVADMKDLWTEFKDSPGKAEEKYKGKKIAFRGGLGTPNKVSERASTQVLVMPMGDDDDEGVQCYFEKPDLQAELEKMPNGAWIVGEVTDYRPATKTLQVKQCKLIGPYDG